MYKYTNRQWAGVALTAVVVLGGTSAVHAQTLKQTQFEDGTGSIGVAPGWHVDGANHGSVQCLGPNGAAVVLKVPWTIMLPNSSLSGFDGAQAQPTAPAGDVVTALREMIAKKIGATLKSVRMSRAKDVSPGSPAYILMYEYTQNEKQMTGLGYFASLNYGGGQAFWQLYSSAIVAPTKNFAAMAPTMIRMWRSWKPNGLPPKEGSSSAIFDDILKDRQLSYEKIQKEAGKLL